MNAIIQAGRLAAFLDHLDPIVTESKLRFGETELRSRAVDPANVAMVSLSLNDGAFESYGVSQETILGVNLERLAEVVGFADSGELVHLELDDETRKLHIDVGGLHYELALIDPDSIRQEPDIPDLDLDAEIVMEARDLTRGIDAADMVSDHISLAADEDAREFTIEAEGDTDDVSVTLGRDDMIEADVSGEPVSLYSLDYLDDLKSPWSAGSEVSIRLGDELPVKISGGFADGEGEFTDMLAPRIQSEA